MVSFEELVNLIAEKKLVWVRFWDDIKICLIGVENHNLRTFKAKFLPCAQNSRVYIVPYEKIKSVEPTEEKDKDNV